MEPTNSFGKFLEELRGKISLRKAADKSGLSHAYIRDLELGRNRTTNDVIKPSPETLRKLSLAYQYSYTELLMKAGYLEENTSSHTFTEIQLSDIWYLEFGIKSVRYYTYEGYSEEMIDSLVDFTTLIETLTDRDFVKLDTNLFVNMNKINKYAPAEGKLYFDFKNEEIFVTIAALAQKKYHEAILEFVAANTGVDMKFESEASTPSLSSHLFS
ncbi:helix-turn-helix transcriptional regulator [Paenibacillus sp. SYP-B3998]|uniref:Helix-turn-helix transcriptional regulator n=1 Tax=Paenibacillus sp. SYP-B3998 TaxID=2678564 RepID=A0A6G3ZYW0_9BACL|nr:helix-turn-helix transcriptional regulator [Paenibacillus sp. SYP-B3998]NEW07238.1 helix-turn-helix transcriptional regulator [Paenibacillus sp. SYP-B3998]